MALKVEQLTKTANLRAVGTGTKSRQRFVYEAGADAVATVVAAGYFNGAREFLNVGDLIDVVAATGTAYRVLQVATVPAVGANVTVVALLFS